MAEERGKKKGMPEPSWETVEFFDPLPDEGSDPVWRDVEHGLGSMDLLVYQNLGGENAQGKVEWITNEQLLVQLSDRNTVRIRWELAEVTMQRFGLSNPRVRLTIWRW